MTAVLSNAITMKLKQSNRMQKRDPRFFEARVSNLMKTEKKTIFSMKANACSVGHALLMRSLIVKREVLENRTPAAPKPIRERQGKFHGHLPQRKHGQKHGQKSWKNEARLSRGHPPQRGLAVKPLRERFT